MQIKGDAKSYLPSPLIKSPSPRQLLVHTVINIEHAPSLPKWTKIVYTTFDWPDFTLSTYIIE